MTEDQAAALTALAVAEPRARARAGGLLAGPHVLVGDRLLPRWADGRRLALPAGTTVRCEAMYEAWARHPSGAVLELYGQVDGGTVKAIWWRGTHADRTETIPAGFLWARNDDCYQGWVELDVLDAVRDERTAVRIP